MKILFLADPLAKIKPRTDTSLALVREALSRGDVPYWAVPTDLRLENGKLSVRSVRCVACPPGELPRLGEAKDSALRHLDVVWIRKDPPFDSSYLSLCWLLSLEEENICILNRPSLLTRYHEKLLPFEAVAQGFLKPSDLVPTHIGGLDSARAFLKRGGWAEAIRKPFFGFGGADIKRFSVEQELPPTRNDDLELTQPFLAEIAQKGDRRIFYLRGKVIGHFVRLPRSGDHVSNIAHGGTGHLVPMSASQKSVAESLGRFLKKIGVDFAGVDMIGRRISEVNITSPTGIRTYAELSGIDLAPKLAEHAQRLAE